MSLTIERLNAMIAEIRRIPPPPFFASSAMLPNHHAIKFQFECREYLGAGPAFWARLPRERLAAYDPWAIPIHDLDIEEKIDLRKEFFGALCIIVSSGAGPIEDAIATAIERGYK